MVATTLDTVREILVSYTGQERQKASDYVDSTSVVNADQLWFWTEEWQVLEAEADRDYAEGHYTSHANMDDFIAALDS